MQLTPGGHKWQVYRPVEHHRQTNRNGHGPSGETEWPRFDSFNCCVARRRQTQSRKGKGQGWYFQNETEKFGMRSCGKDSKKGKCKL
jgi:hypothetical protein